MLSGTVIFAQRDAGLADSVKHVLCVEHPGVHVERTCRGDEALMMQSVMRADAVLMDMNLPDMSGAHLLCELKRDIVSPYVVVCSRETGMQAARRAMKMGANSYVSIPADVMQVCQQIEDQLRRRHGEGYTKSSMAEAMLQRIFTEYGVSCSVKGYGYLKCALKLLASGEGHLDSMHELYERISDMQGCTAGAVEHGIRYAVDHCRRRIPGASTRISGSREFIARLLEESGMGRTTLLQPKVSVFCSGRRVFR